MDNFPGRLGLQQRVLPAYRAPFFDVLAKKCNGGLSIFAGKPLPVEQIPVVEALPSAHVYPAKNFNFMNPSSSFYQCWQAGICSWLDEWRPDALVVEANPRFISTRCAIARMHRSGLPVLGWGLGAPLPKGLLMSLPIKARSRFLSSLDAMIAYSHRGAEEFQRAGFPPSRIFVALNAVAPRPERPPVLRSTEFDKRAIVLFVGRLQSRKRLDLLMYACAAMPDSIKPEVWIVGDGPAKEEFESVARQVYPGAKFLGARYGNDLIEIYNRADLFVLPGTGGLAIQEAMAHGLPVIVAEGDGTQDDLVRSDNGWLVPASDLPALIHSLQDALNNPQELRQMGEASFRIVYEEANIEKMVVVFLEALSSVIR